ncbi:hypothetical protein DVH05_014580 [Phytophthora capsici]|nr:hypothetical protein DVH05_014580 [Phytophthora capsici]
MGSESSPERRRRVNHLSTGHRIHQLIYNAERQSVEVKRIVQREPHDPEVAYMSYNYSLKVGLTKSFQPHQQICHRRQLEALDNLLCGYLNDMADTMKCRRIRFAIVLPLVSKDRVGVDVDPPTAYAAIIEFLQSRVASSKFGDAKNIVVNMLLECPESTQEGFKAPPIGGNRMLK